MADIIVKSYKAGSYSKYGSMLEKVKQQVAAQNPANQGVPGADPNEVARQLLASRNPAAQNPANQGVPGSDPNAVAKQLLASSSTGAVAAAPTSAPPGPGLGMLQGYNQPGPLGTSLASSQLGTLPGGVTGAGRSVGEAGPMKMAAVQGLFAGSIPLRTKTL